MRVTLLSRPDLHSAPGGDTVQIIETARALNALGVTAEISVELRPQLDAVDLVHIFNITRPHEALEQLHHAKSSGRLVALSPIFCPMTEFERACRPQPLRSILRHCQPETIEYAKLLAKSLRSWKWTAGLRQLVLRGYKHCIAELVRSADVILPNSESELRRLRAWFPAGDLDGVPYRVVPNAVSDVFLQEPEAVEPNPRYRDCVLCVARIDGAKGQLALVRALKDVDVLLVLAGKPGPNSIRYHESVRAEAGPNVLLLGQVPRSQLPSLYRAARVHVLPSWMETTGLSSLEAAAMGCNIVVTPNGDTTEYFGGEARYCTAGDESSIRKAVLDAYDAPSSRQLRHKILQGHTWQHAAAASVAAYAEALRSRFGTPPVTADGR